MGLFKKFYGCRSCGGRVRQKPLRVIQLDMFGEFNNEEMLYVRSQKARSKNGTCAESEDVFGRRPVDSSDERSSGTDAWWI